MFLYKVISWLETIIVSNPILLRSWYELISLLDKDNKALLINYGYQGKGSLKLDKFEELNRYRLQLYYEVGRQVNLKDKVVLEVGSGRGGGASFLTQKFSPKSYMGVDFSSLAIKFCKGFYEDPRLNFIQADAHKLPFKPISFDIVINIESAHLYKDMGQFFKEAYRVLRPKGYFLLADIRDSGEVDKINNRLLKAGFKIIKSKNITPGVLKGLDNDNPNKMKLIKSKVPKLLQEPFKVFSGVKDSPNYLSFKSGQRTYWLSVLQK